MEPLAESLIFQKKKKTKNQFNHLKKTKQTKKLKELLYFIWVPCNVKIISSKSF